MNRKLLCCFLLVCITFYTYAQAPGNDCANAAPLTLLPGTTMSTGFQSVPSSFTNEVLINDICTAFTYYGTSKDGIYSFEVTNPGDYSFQFANNGTTWKSLSVYSACPTLATCLGSIETGSQRDAPVPATINLPTTGTYYIVVDGWTAAASYPLNPFDPVDTSFSLPAPVSTPYFEIFITSPIGNDECANAIELFSDVDCSILTYTNEGATASGGHPAPTCANYQGGDVWFTYEVNSTGSFTITTEAGVMLDSGLAVYAGTCGSLTQIDCDDDFGTGAMSTITVNGRTPGEIMYIRLWEYGNNNNGTFGICITTPIPPGDNGVFNACPNERSQSMTSDFVCPPGINSSNTVFGNLEGGALAPRPNGFIANSPTCGFSGLNRRYEEINFTVPTTGLYVIDMSAAAGFDGMAYIVEAGFTPGVCGSGTYLVGDDDSGTGLRPRLSVNLVAGTNYTLITTEYGLGSGNSPYTWTVTTGPNINWETIFPIEWYTTASGGTPIETGPGFNPVNYPGSGLTDTSTPGVYSFWYACPGSPGSRTKVDYVIGKNWNGSVNSNWNEPNNWTPSGVPSLDECVYIPDDGTVPNSPSANQIATPALGRTLTLQSGAYLEVETNAELMIRESVTVQATGILNLKNSGSLIQLDDAASNSGNIYVQRSPNFDGSAVGTDDYVYWSSPVQNFSVTSISPSSTRFYGWTPSAPGNGLGNHGEWYEATGTMDAATGYIIKGLGGTPANIPSTAYAIPNNTALFEGTPNNGVITKQIYHGNYIGAPYLGVGTVTSATDEDDNWNLIGNPYPSAISANAFVDLNTNINGTIYMWDHTNAYSAVTADPFYEDFAYSYDGNDYFEHNNTGSNPPGTNDLFIGSGQGFFVFMNHSATSGSNVTFNNSMRYDNAIDDLIPNYDNSDFYRLNTDQQRSVTAIERHRIWLDLLAPNNTTNSILVGYVTNATNDFDRLYDGYDFNGDDTGFYSLVNDKKLSIQGREFPFNSEDLVPLGVLANTSGSHTIAINTVDGLFLNENQGIYIEDLELNLIHNLRQSPYTFTISEGRHNDRFVLRYTDDTLSIDEVELNDVVIMAPKGDYVKINAGKYLIDKVLIYDLLGRPLINNANINSSECIVQNDNLSDGAYIVEVTLSNGLTKSQKVILKR